MNKNKKIEVLKENSKNQTYKNFIYLILIVIVVLLFANFKTKKLESLTFAIKIVSASNNSLWSNDNKIEIFNSNRNDSSDTKVIYPGVSGAYYFKIYNDMDTDLDYIITGYEEGDVLPKMEYQLLKASEIEDNNAKWESISEIRLSDNLLSKGESEYVLRWKWNENDSFINEGGYYTLHLVVSYGD